MDEPLLLHEDDLMVAVDKPAGLAVAPPRGRGESLTAWVRGRWGDQAAAAHRLDDEASGVVLCAKTKGALDFLSGQFQAKAAGRVFLALAVVGEPGVLPKGAESSRVEGVLAGEFEVDLPLGEDTERPGVMRISRGRLGKPAVTRVRVLESFGRFAWLECRAASGRPHQVRVHLAACGVPVLGDALYGDPAVQLLLSGLKRGYKGRDAERPLLSRLALHGSAVTFLHPADRQPREVVAPVPEAFEIALKYLRRFTPGRRR
jgi:23S rRNA pseudouridine1911/1915/1917 synthase